MGEQGAESIHAHLMRLERIHKGIASDVDRLCYIMKEHNVRVCSIIDMSEASTCQEKKSRKF